MTKLCVIIDRIVLGSVESLFSNYGFEVKKDTSEPSPHDRFAVIGFGGDDIRGAIAIGMDNVMLETFAAQFAVDVGPVDSDDLLAEWANQLMGLVKTELVRYGATFGISLPMVVRGVEVRICGSSREDVRALRFRGGGATMSVLFDATCTPDFSLGATVDESASAAQGDVLIF